VETRLGGRPALLFGPYLFAHNPNLQKAPRTLIRSFHSFVHFLMQRENLAKKRQLQHACIMTVAI
jgi:hypothetical protein